MSRELISNNLKAWEEAHRLAEHLKFVVGALMQINDVGTFNGEYWRYRNAKDEFLNYVKDFAAFGDGQFMTLSGTCVTSNTGSKLWYYNVHDITRGKINKKSKKDATEIDNTIEE